MGIRILQLWSFIIPQVYRCLDLQFVSLASCTRWLVRQPPAGTWQDEHPTATALTSQPPFVSLLYPHSLHDRNVFVLSSRSTPSRNFQLAHLVVITMAEVVGLVASIIQIAGTGAKLSTALYHYTTSAVRADQDITEIASDVDLTSNALESIGKVFETEYAKSLVSNKAIHDAKSIIKRCEAVFNDITELVDKRRKMSKDGKKSLGVMGKLTWPLKEQRVELYRRRLESLKTSLALLLHVLQLAQGQARGYVWCCKMYCGY
jgi:hypothetical protein